MYAHNTQSAYVCTYIVCFMLSVRVFVIVCWRFVGLRTLHCVTIGALCTCTEGSAHVLFFRCAFVHMWSSLEAVECSLSALMEGFNG